MLNIQRVRVAFLSSEYLLLAQDPALEYGVSLTQGAPAPVELTCVQSRTYSCQGQIQPSAMFIPGLTGQNPVLLEYPYKTPALTALS